MGHPVGCLLPLPHFGDCVAGRVDFVFKGSAGVVDARELLRRRLEEEHASIADGTTGTEFADAGSGPGDALAVLGHGDALSMAEDGAVGTDYGGVGSHARGGDAE